MAFALRQGRDGDTLKVDTDGEYVSHEMNHWICSTTTDNSEQLPLLLLFEIEWVEQEL